jgi:hypothetical protein
MSPSIRARKETQEEGAHKGCDHGWNTGLAVRENVEAMD